MNFKETLGEKYKLSNSDWDFTIKCFVPESINSKSYFLKEGNISNRLGVIKTGLFRSFIYDDNRNEITTHFFLPGTVVISIESFNNKIPATENIIAIEDCELLVISSEKMRELYKIVPVWQQICKDVAEIKNQALINRSIRFQTLSASERYKLFCKEFPEVIQKVALGHIAAYLGIDKATLSRIRKKY